MNSFGLLALLLTGSATFYLASCVSMASVSSSQILHVSLGGVVSLHCDTGLFAGNDDKDSAIHSMPLIWQRFDMEDNDNNVFISHGEALMVDDPRLTLSHGASMLTIHDAQFSDSGTYQCRLASDNEEIAGPLIEVIVASEDKRSGSSTIIASSLYLVALAFFLR